ncbi:MAG: thimet oligopeptidase [Planctomycetota bacterium]|jgi:thimet oligopeptidase
MTHSSLRPAPESLAADGAAAIKNARGALEQLLALPADTDGLSMLAAYDAIGQCLNGLGGWTEVYVSAHPDKAVREAGEGVQQELAAFGTELGLHRGLYERLAAVELAQDASFEERRCLAHALRDFRRSGVDKDEATRERIKKLQEELVTVGQTFDRNIIEGQRTIAVAGGHAELAGLPQDYLDAHPEDDSGVVTITSDPNDFMPVMLYAESDDVRKRLMFESRNRAHPGNVEPLSQILALRHELAGLLGYDSWAAYATEDKMIGSAQAAQDFLDKVSGRARDAGEQEAVELLAELRKLNPAAERVEQHQFGFLKERIKRDRLAFDSQSIRPYFAYERIHAGVLAVAERLYGVTFRPAPQLETWHASVRSYEVLDGECIVARFYLDMWPRDDKYKHAAMYDVAAGTSARDGAEEVLPEAVLLCNFPEPTDTDPGLMLHHDVTTFFHEFGHLLHHLFGGDHRYIGFSGIATEWDFVEVPSQLFEEWAWNADVLATFAIHEETGEAITPELVQSLRRAEEYGKALGVLTQMVYASVSLAIHASDPAQIEPDAVMADLRKQLTPFEEPADYHFTCSFGHLNGYSAIYYTYMWSLVISKDLWGQFEAAPMDRETADRYRQEVLRPGGSKDAADLVHGFLGRPYAFDAFDAWLRA